jgi:leucyl aminopeptidase
MCAHVHSNSGSVIHKKELLCKWVYSVQNTSELLTALGVKVIVRDKSWAESKKMGSFLSVARGSIEPPVFLELHYSAASNKGKPIAFVGKFCIV